MKYLIYHHNDNDGYLAAAIAKAYLTKENEPYKDIQFRVGSYDGNDDEAAVEWADQVFILDYRLPPALMDKHYDKIVWIDHHKTAIEQMQTIIDSKNRPLPGLREIGRSGCLLTWEYFFGAEATIPLAVALVNDRDVWDWKLGEDTAAFHEASRMFMLYYDEWIKLLYNNALTDRHVKTGHQLLGYIRDIVDVYNETYSFEGSFEGYPVVFLNGSGVISGELHKRLRETHPFAVFAITFILSYDKVRVGLYRADGQTADLGKIALKYGGGGHEGASGFYTTHEEWIKILGASGASPGYRRDV